MSATVQFVKHAKTHSYSFFTFYASFHTYTLIYYLPFGGLYSRCALHAVIRKAIFLIGLKPASLARGIWWKKIFLKVLLKVLFVVEIVETYFALKTTFAKMTFPTWCWMNKCSCNILLNITSKDINLFCLFCICNYLYIFIYTYVDVYMYII